MQDDRICNNFLFFLSQIFAGGGVVCGVFFLRFVVVCFFLFIYFFTLLFFFIMLGLNCMEDHKAPFRYFYLWVRHTFFLYNFAGGRVTDKGKVMVKETVHRQ